MGFRVEGLWFEVQGLGLWVYGCGVPGFRFRALDLGSHRMLPAASRSRRAEPVRTRADV